MEIHRPIRTQPLVNDTFQMESSLSIQEALHPGIWVTCIDLTEAYLHILIYPIQGNT